MLKKRGRKGRFKRAGVKAATKLDWGRDEIAL
jgi:hypothetical protein